MEKTNGSDLQKEKEEDKTVPNIIPNIIENYRSLENSIVNQLSLYKEFHSTTTGTSREDIWLQLFETIVPKKFVIEHSVFIIDSYHHVSKEIDLAIVDNVYTPYIFQYGRLKFIPIEAVAAVIECKSSSVTWSAGKKTKVEAGDSKGGLDDWLASINQLRTSRESIVRMAAGAVIEGITYTKHSDIIDSTQTSTRPIRIFCGYQTNNYIGKIKENFDFTLIAENNKTNGIKITARNFENLERWYNQLDHFENDNADNKIDCKKLNQYLLEDLEIKDTMGEIVSLLTFNFQLNQLLMLINNPILFPHLAYTKMFNGKERKL